MCNFAVEFDIENKGLNKLCRASWLLDHDMFEVNFILTLIIYNIFSYLILFVCNIYFDFHRKLWIFWPAVMNGWLMINLGIGITGQS